MHPAEPELTGEHEGRRRAAASVAGQRGTRRSRLPAAAATAAPAPTSRARAAGPRPTPAGAASCAPNRKMTVTMVEVLAVLVAGLALTFSIWSLRWTQRQTRLTRTQDHLRHVVRLTQGIRQHDFRISQSDALAFYRREAACLSMAGRTHLHLLDELDLLSFGIAKGSVDGEVAMEYLQSTYGAHVADTVHFINQLRICFGDPGMYKHLYAILPSLPERTPSWATAYSPDTPNPYGRQETTGDDRRPNGDREAARHTRLPGERDAEGEVAAAPPEPSKQEKKGA